MPKNVTEWDPEDGPREKPATDFCDGEVCQMATEGMTFSQKRQRPCLRPPVLRSGTAEGGEASARQARLRLASPRQRVERTVAAALARERHLVDGLIKRENGLVFDGIHGVAFKAVFADLPNKLPRKLSGLSGKGAKTFFPKMVDSR